MKKIDGYLKRAVIYISIAVIGLGHELIFIRPIRTMSLFLWMGLLSIGVFVMFTLKDPVE